MAGRGRPPTPTALKALRGNPGKRRGDDEGAEPMPEVAVPTCPQHLDGTARGEWKRIVPELVKLGLLTVIDRTALAAYCVNYSRWLAAEKILKEQGLTFTTAKGYVGQRPEVGIANTAMHQMRAFLSEFGMTPASRTRIKVKPKEKPADEARGFLFGRNGDAGRRPA